KGGFYPKQLPLNAPREAVQEAGISAYKVLINALLDVTDNLNADGSVVPPAGVVRHDGDDPYLVVAADKGTATFSDIANGIAEGRGFWLGDVFANGMLLSKQTRLLAAFDHRHIFLDPDPDAASSWTERKRMFDLPRSSW